MSDFPLLPGKLSNTPTPYDAICLHMAETAEGAVFDKASPSQAAPATLFTSRTLSLSFGSLFP